jgi:hypothetical protein
VGRGRTSLGGDGISRPLRNSGVQGVVLPTVVLLVLAGSSDGLHFIGDSRCPGPAAVDAQLRRIAPGVLEGKAVQIDTLASGLRVRLFDDGGRLLRERTISGPKTCAQWAQISAALLATWAAALVAPDPPLSDLPSSVPPPPAEAAPSASSRASSARWTGELGLGFMGTLANDGSAALALEILAGLTPPRRPYGAQLTLNGTTSRSLPVGDGTAHWQRFALGLGAHGTLGSEELKLEIGAAFLAGLVTSYGSGFPVPSHSADFDPGIAPSVRGRWEFARSWLAWLQIGASFWLKSENVQELSGTTLVHSSQVPPVDLFVTVGLSLTADL